MNTSTVKYNHLRKCFSYCAVLLGIAIWSLFLTATGDAAMVVKNLQIDFTFDSVSLRDRQIFGYRLYMDGVMLCEAQNVKQQVVSCPVAAEEGTHSFTLSTLYGDGSESPQSAPHIATLAIMDSDADGIADRWERRYFGNLMTANASTDYDHDGYTDLTEYNIGETAECDSRGKLFNPKEVNLPRRGNVGDGAGSVVFPADSLLLNVPGDGIHDYMSASLLTQTKRAQPNLTVIADIDADGIDEIISFFEEDGLYVWDNGVWSSRICSAEPETMIKFGNRLAIDFGPAYGLFTYSLSEGLTQIDSVDPTLMTEADVDSDGVMELVSYFAGDGLYVWDDGAWSKKTTAIFPDSITTGNITE